MGVIPGTKMLASGGKKVKGALKKAENAINSTIARRAALSPEDLKAIEVSRDKYLQGKPDPTDPAEVALTMRLMAANSIEIYNAYLPLISSLYYPIQPEAEFEGAKFDAAHNDTAPATQIHHIFPVNEFPEIMHYIENMIADTHVVKPKSLPPLDKSLITNRNINDAMINNTVTKRDMNTGSHILLWKNHNALSFF